MNTYNFIVDGQSISSAKVFEVKNPATGELLGYAPVSSETDVERAVASAKKAQKTWAAKSDEERKAILMEVAQVLTDKTPYLAEWITKEQGKPMAGPGSMFEMQACVGWTQVPASLDLPVETVFEDETRKDEMHR
ncbi:MAG: aldehyde dehydrogenase family protein, partial [Bacteroidota bacterium]